MVNVEKLNAKREMKEGKLKLPTTVVARRRKIKQLLAQKASEVSQSNKPSESDSFTADKKTTSSKPPPHSKRKTSPVVVSDEDDKSPPRTRQAQKKKQKAATPSRKEKGSGSSKLTSPGDKVSSEESPLKGGSNAFVVESHNSSPDNILTKDDVGTATSDLKSFTLNIDLDKLQGKSHVLSPVIEDAQPLATIIPSTAVEGSHSTDDSPPTHKSEKADQQCSGSNNAAGHPTGSEDTLSEQDVREETSKLTTVVSHETTTFGTIVSPETTSTPAPTKPTPSELEELKQTDPLSFLKAMMDIDNTSPSELKTSPAVQPESGIQHFEAARKLVPEIDELKKQRALIELRMSSWEIQYSKTKDSLPKDFN
ncbi:uncharacterized protein LOC131649034 [Vicia villosa]|uniref:uncharacterized protein LOC131649034 n=1 Tax=Vicia villosa TaxID=3911 RepID=UPI00273CB308|nr:uncharacterized protein LOC131649034 [Vicia villosa]